MFSFFSLRPLFLFSSLEISQVLFSSRFFRSPNPKKERISHTMPPAPVPETALKKRRRDEEWAAARASAAAEARSKRAASRADAFKRAESYVKEYRAQVRPMIFFPLVSLSCRPLSPPAREREKEREGERRRERESFTIEAMAKAVVGKRATAAADAIEERDQSLLSPSSAPLLLPARILSAVVIFRIRRETMVGGKWRLSGGA